MRRNLKNILFIFLVVTVMSFQAQAAGLRCARVFQKSAVTVEQLLRGDKRPSAAEIMSLSQSDRDALIRRDVNPANDYNQVFRALAEISKEIVNNWDGRPIILLGRDSELIYDTLQYLFIASNTPASVSERVFLVTLSRPMIENSSYSQLRAYFNKNAGVDLGEIANDKQKVRIFDTGNRGTIYLKILNLMLGHIKNNDPEWKAKVLNSLRNIDFVLLATEEDSTVKKVAKTIDAMTEFDRDAIEQLFDRDADQLFFRQLSVPGAEKKKLIPRDLDERYDWVVANIEYQPHWEGRTLRLTENGKDRTYPLENDPRVNKNGYLIRQIQLINFLESSSEVQSIVDLFANRSNGSNDLKEKKKDPKKDKANKKPDPKPPEEKPVKPVVQKVEGIVPQSAMEFNPGAVVNLQGTNYRVDSSLGSGKRGRVYKVIDLQTQVAYALKVAKLNDEETLNSFRREAAKQEAYERAGIPFAAIVKQDAVWILKDLVQGERADSWLNSWDLNTDPRGGNRLRNLVALFNTIADRGIYIGDLNPTNLIWKNNRWVIVDSGDASYDYSSKKARKRFYEKNKERWERYFPTDQKRKVFKEVLKEGLLSQFSILSSLNTKVA